MFPFFFVVFAMMIIKTSQASCYLLPLLLTTRHGVSGGTREEQKNGKGKNETSFGSHAYKRTRESAFLVLPLAGPRREGRRACASSQEDIIIIVIGEVARPHTRYLTLQSFGGSAKTFAASTIGLSTCYLHCRFGASNSSCQQSSLPRHHLVVSYFRLRPA